MGAIMRNSYKPKVDELILHAPIEELRLNQFKGVPCKILRISGDLLKSIDHFLHSQDPLKVTNRGREESTEAILRNFFNLTEKYIDARKKRYFKTGIRFDNSQLLITEFVYPVPHVKHMSIVLVTLDLMNFKSNEYWMRSSFWCLNYDAEMPKELQDYYSENVDMQPSREDEGLEAMLIRLLFDIVPPKAMAA